MLIIKEMMPNNALHIATNVADGGGERKTTISRSSATNNPSSGYSEISAQASAYEAFRKCVEEYNSRIFNLEQQYKKEEEEMIKYRDPKQELEEQKGIIDSIIGTLESAKTISDSIGTIGGQTIDYDGQLTGEVSVMNELVAEINRLIAELGKEATKHYETMKGLKRTISTLEQQKRSC